MNAYPERLQRALERNETVLMCCNCSIRYSGRAESLLGNGDRIIIIKADKTLIVHQPEGNNPVNYMKPGTSFLMVPKEKGWLLKAANLPLKEFIDIEIFEMHYFYSRKLEDSQSITVAGTEEDMTNMIMQQPELIEQGFKPVSQEEQTKYGYIDVLGYDKDRTLVVVECKRFHADFNAVQQLRRYVEKIKESKGINIVRGILAAPKITPNAEQMLKDWGFEFKTVKPPRYLEEFDKRQRKLEGF